MLVTIGVAQAVPPESTGVYLASGLVPLLMSIASPHAWFDNDDESRPWQSLRVFDVQRKL